jgi:Polyketide cyclase / dehydrase and lipid transport
MASFEDRIPSQWTPDETFSYLAMFSNARDWDPGVLEANRLDSGPVRTGSQFRLVVPFGRRKLELIYRVVSLSQEDREITLAARSALLAVTDHIGVGPAGPVLGQTFVDYRAEAKLRGPARLLDPVLRRGFNAVGERAAVGLAAALSEPQPAAAPPPAGPADAVGPAGAAGSAGLAGSAGVAWSAGAAGHAGAVGSAQTPIARTPGGSVQPGSVPGPAERSRS